MKKSYQDAEPAAAAAAAAAEYSAAELAKAAPQIFGVSPDIVTAALAVAGIKSATIEAAEKIVKEFANKEVK